MIPFRTSAKGALWPVVTLLVVAMNTVVFLGEASLEPSQLDALIRIWGVRPARELAALSLAPARFDLWLLPPFTSMFLHGGWAHLIGNMLYLWVFGSTMESRVGHGRFFILYIIGGLTASQAQVISAPMSDLPMVGASGAIAAVLGAFIVSFPRSKVAVIIPLGFWPLFIDLPAVLVLGVWFVEQIAAAALLVLSPVAAAAGGVAWWAHAGGFVGGAILIKVLGFHPGPEQRRRLVRYDEY